jgi:predicted glycogen debranching enzyme
MIHFGREITGHFEAAVRREWLVTNGIGGFASGTVAGMNTRRYHGLLVASLKPPVGRVMVLARLDELATLSGHDFALATNEWAGGTIAPRGDALLQSFQLDGTTPVFTYALGDGLLQKRIWMTHGANTTYVTYELVRGRGPIRMVLTPIGGWRDFHVHNVGATFKPRVEPVESGVRVEAYTGASPYWIKVNRGAFHMEPTTYWGFFHRVEAYRGLDTMEDLLSPGRFSAELKPGETLTFVVSLHEEVEMDGAAAYKAERLRQDALVDRANLTDQPRWVQQLVLAADQLIVDRPLPSNETRADTARAPSVGKSIIAGYHWFGDWGRDTMISLPGLTLATGRPDVAATILRTFSRYVDQGMLPNRFPDAGQPPEYNTADATLWYFQAIYSADRYSSATREEGRDRTGEAHQDLVADLYPTLAEIIEWHRRGTRYRIQLDERDGLLYAGEPGVQLTWMDAKVDDWVVTPRYGKAVEINALWYSALRVMAAFARRLDKHEDAVRWTEMADQTAASFRTRFWYAEGNHLYDVVDGPSGDDPALRPNQLLAVSLPYSPLMPDQARAVVDACAATLLTAFGLRSLAPNDPQYVGVYGGDRWQRDGAYHQGAVWGWLIGPFVEAHFKVYRDAALARSFLLPFADHLSDHGVGSISEIYDGDPPHAPRGCIAQAWSVAEVLRAWLTVRS